MKMRHARFGALLPVLLVAACAGLPPHQALPDAARDKITSTELVAAIPQSEIYVYVPPTTAGAGFGLVGAIVDVSVDSVRTSKAETAVKPLRDALVDYDFDGAFKDQIKTTLSPVAWLGVNDARVVRDVSDANLDNMLTSSSAGAVLFTAADYHVSNDGDVLTIKVRTSLFANNDALRTLQTSSKTPKTALANALYRNLLTFEAKLPQAQDDRDANIAVWCADHGAAMRALMKLGSGKIAAMLAADLGSTAMGTAPAAPQTVKVDGVQGDVIATDADGDLVRMKDGTLAYVTRTLL